MSQRRRWWRFLRMIGREEVLEKPPTLTAAWGRKRVTWVARPELLRVFPKTENVIWIQHLRPQSLVRVKQGAVIYGHMIPVPLKEYEDEDEEGKERMTLPTPVPIRILRAGEAARVLCERPVFVYRLSRYPDTEVEAVPAYLELGADGVERLVAPRSYGVVEAAGQMGSLLAQGSRPTAMMRLAYWSEVVAEMELDPPPTAEEMAFLAGSNVRSLWRMGYHRAAVERKRKRKQESE